MNQKDFKKTINEILTEGKIEGKDIKNIDTSSKCIEINILRNIATKNIIRIITMYKSVLMLIFSFLS